MKSARVITTFECNRNCPYCSNNYESLISQGREEDNLNFIKDYDEIILTGGEPMLYPGNILFLLKVIRKVNPDVKIYLYTAYYTHHLETIIKYVDGITYTLHENASWKDINKFNAVEQMITYNRDKKFRLFINENNQRQINIRPYLWDRIKIAGTLSEEDCDYPEDDLIILKEWGL